MRPDHSHKAERAPPAFQAFAIKGTAMPTHHVIAVVALVLVSIGVGLQLAQLSSVHAQHVERVAFSNWSNEGIQNVKNLPMQQAT
jgi:hypothetical protein